MKKLLLITKTTQLCCIVAVLFISLSVSAQVHSDEVLYANGHLNYEKKNWNYAAAYLFAFIQRNPGAMQRDPTFNKEVVDAFNHSMKALNQQVIDLKNCNDKVAFYQNKDKDGVASITSGLETTPPPLRAPSKVRFAATIFQEQQIKTPVVDTSRAIKVQKVVVNQ